MLARIITATASPIRRFAILRQALGLGGIALLASCAATTATDGESTGSDESSLLVKLPNVTAAGPHGITNIDVCWDMPGDDALKLTLQHGAEDSWMRFTNVQFSGWGICLPPNLSNVFPGVRFSFFNGSDAPYTTPDRTEIRLPRMPGSPEYMVSSFIHELGHVLGFMHEQIRFDKGPVAAVCIASPASADKNFWQQRYDQSDTRGYGQWDLFSIMNYCQPNYSTRAVDALDHLGPSDVYGAQALYGAKPKGSLVAVGGKCLNVPNARLDQTNALAAHDCWNDAPSGTWTFDFSNGEIKSLLPPPGSSPGPRTPFCVDPTGADPKALGSPATTACAGAPRQSFYLTKTSILYHGLCFTRTPHNGQTIVNLELCQANQANQEWQIHPSGEISAPTGSLTKTDLTGQMCLDPQWANNAPLIVAPCDGTHRQQWTFQDGGQLQALENKCVAVPGDFDAASPSISSQVISANGMTTPSIDGTHLGVTSCAAGSPGQKFSVSGFLQSGLTSCLRPMNGQGLNGVPFESTRCTYDRTERIDYYPAGQYTVPLHSAAATIDAPLNQTHGPYGLSNPVHFQGSVAHMGDLSKLKITWTSNIDGGIGTSLSFNYGFGTPGPRTITLRVEDPNGVVATRTTVYTADSSPPGAAILEPQDGAQEKRDQPFNLRGNGSTPSTLSLPCDHLEWRFDLAPSWSATGCTATASFSVLGAGTLSLHVRDEAGQTAIASRRVTIIDPGPVVVPWASISEPTTPRISVAATTRLSGSGGDASGQQVTYRWAVVDPSSGRELPIGNGPVIDWVPSSTLPWPSCGYSVDLRFYATTTDGRAGVADTHVNIACVPQ